MCHRNTTEEYAYYVLGERTEREEERERSSPRIDGEPTRVARNADD